MKYIIHSQTSTGAHEKFGNEFHPTQYIMHLITSINDTYWGMCLCCVDRLLHGWAAVNCHCNKVINTLKPSKMTTILQTTICNSFTHIRMVVFDSNYNTNSSQRFNQLYAHIGSDNGVTSITRQNIIWSNAGLTHTCVTRMTKVTRSTVHCKVMHA